MSTRYWIICLAIAMFGCDGQRNPDARSPAVDRDRSSMKKSSEPDDDLLPEYDFGAMKGRVRGKYSRRIRQEGTNLVLLDPEVAQAFPSEASVNEALRGVLNTTRAVRRSGGLPNKALQPTSRAQGKAKSAKRSRAARG